MTMTMQLTTFTTCFGNNKAENQNLILAFSLTDRKYRDCCCKKSSIKTLRGDFWTCL